MREINPKTLLPAFVLIGILAFPIVADAKEISAPDIRPVISTSTDSLGELMQLRRADNLRASGQCAAALPVYARLHGHDENAARDGYRACAIALGHLPLARSLVTDIMSTDAILIDVMSGRAAAPDATLRQALKSAPNDGRLWNMLGHVLDTDGRHLAARHAYVMAGDTEQRNGVMENNMGQSFLLEGQFKTAAEHFALAAKLDPTRAIYDNNRRRALALFGDYAAALSGLNSNRSALLLRETGEMAIERGELRLARLMLRRSARLASRHDPKTATLMTQLEQQ